METYPGLRGNSSAIISRASAHSGNVTGQRHTPAPDLGGGDFQAMILVALVTPTARNGNVSRPARPLMRDYLTSRAVGSAMLPASVMLAISVTMSSTAWKRIQSCTRTFRLMCGPGGTGGVRTGRSVRATQGPSNVP